MKITKKWLKEKNACAEGIAWWENQTETGAVSVIRTLLDSGKFDWANWTITHVFTRRQNIQYAIFAAEQVIGLFEKKYPDDKRPRNAIEAARLVLENDTPAADAYAADAYAADAYAAYASASASDTTYAASASAAAAYAAYAAADAASASASDTTYAYAAYASASASDATYAASASAAAAYAAYAYAATYGVVLKTKIVEYGISILEDEK
jgi:hypothetical protein